MSSFYGSAGDGEVSITQGSSENYAQVYTVKQGEKTIGTINIPKDLVIENGEVVTDPPEMEERGTYIKLTLANSEEKVLYINVTTLVDIYVASEDSAINLTITDRTIKAGIKNGSITKEMLSNETIDDIKEKAVTEAKNYTNEVKSTFKFYVDEEDGSTLIIEYPE